jgi:hypothetical protein
MDCLANRIGIRGCDAPKVEGQTLPTVIEALPVLFVNDLPGVTNEMIQDLLDAETLTYLELWSKIVLRTMKKFDVLVKAKINECHKICANSVIECLVCENKKSFDVCLWYLHGVELMTEITSSSKLSEMTTTGLERAERLKAEFYSDFKDAFKGSVSAMNILESTCVADKVIKANESVSWQFTL